MYYKINSKSNGMVALFALRYVLSRLSETFFFILLICPPPPRYNPPPPVYKPTKNPL